MNVYDLLHKELKRLDIKEESIKDEIKDLPLGTLVRIKRNDNNFRIIFYTICYFLIITFL